MDYDDIPDACNYLKDPLSFTDLMDGGASFEIDCNFNDAYANDIDELNIGSDDDDETSEIDRNALISPWTKPFDELKQQMVRLNEHLYKRIIKKGKEEQGMVPLNARVRLRYNAYWELEGAPFDSSFLRDSAFSFYTGCNEVLEGLEAAVLTMHVGEHAQFIISYKLLFREMGCPPRVRPKADGLFIIEINGFNVVGDINAVQKVAPEDRNKYNLVVEKVKEIHLKGLDFFNQRQFSNAARAFEKAVSVLNFCQLANEEEQRDQTAFLLKLYTNLAVCFIKINKPTKTCIMVKEIRRLTNNKPSCKALFQEGRALLMLGEYDDSRQILLRCQRMEPQNEDIVREIRILEHRHRLYKNSAKRLWTKAIGILKPEEDKATIDLESEFAKQMTKVLESFKQTDDNNFKLPSGLEPKEMEIVTEIAKTLDLKMKQSFDDSFALYKQ